MMLSDIAFPELPEWVEPDESAAAQGIRVELAELNDAWSALSQPGRRSFAAPGRVMFRVPGTAIYDIRDGRHIAVCPEAHADPDELRLFILGSCMGAALMQRGLLPLHGSAVAIDGQAYGIVGESGAGKSTLAAAFLQAGFPLISDDVIALDFSEEFVRPLVIPSYPQQKLWQQSLDGFGISNESLRPIFKRETKFAVPLKAGYHSQPLPLAGLFELDKTERNEPSLVPVAKLDRLSLLRRHTYRNFWLDRLGMTDWHFRMTAGMAARIDVYRLERPTSGFTAPELVKRMLHILSKEGWSP
ncbi:phosphoenolpyruvate carboxykinase (ATP) [Cohnella rhizosphaerae]|uniref:Aldolase n=1 Tax=Cohnella rhizosphaerae TaxID=1457232 RepID=A0A9X4L1I6_9BACL|nr:aldolase [Cohnella rhizosphaerae]MDG0814411.1 aldolase [Cohnella rhizosphaerae]